MTKTLAAILTAVAIGLLSNAPIAGDSRDLWIGVVGFRDPYQNYRPRGSTSLDSSTVVEPVAAFVGGKWWFSSPGEADQTLQEALQKIPAQWLPPGTALPSSWQGHLFNMGRVRLRAAGPLHRLGDGYDTETLVVDTDLKLPRLKPAETDGEAQGIAVAGNVQVRFFIDLPGPKHAELLRFFSASMLAAERVEIQRRAAGAKGIEGAFPNDADVEQLIGQLASTPFKMQVAKTGTQRGEPIYVIEGDKVLRTSNLVALNTAASMTTGAAARRDRSGALHLLGTWSYLDANESVIQSRPLAVLERNSESCWLVAHTTEGGYKYVLARPGQVDLEKWAFRCDIK